MKRDKMKKQNKEMKEGKISSKKYLDINVYEATIARLELILDEFEKVYISFSGGKDSSVLLQILLEVAERKEKLPVGVLFIDLEGQYKATIKHVEEMLVGNPKVQPYWICLPINLRNAVSVYQSQWQCWDPKEKEKWVRDMPLYDCVISDVDSIMAWSLKTLCQSLGNGIPRVKKQLV